MDVSTASVDELELFNTHLNTSLKHIELCHAQNISTTWLAHLHTQFTTASSSSCSLSSLKKKIQVLYTLFRPSISSAEIQMLFNTIQSAALESRPWDDDKMTIYVTFLTLLAASGTGPLAYFQLTDGITLPEIPHFPKNGYSFACWIRLETIQSQEQPLLFLRGRMGSGVTLLLVSNTLRMIIHDDRKQEDVQYEFKSLFEKKMWKWIVLTHTYRNRLRGSKVDLYVSGKLIESITLLYPNVKEMKPFWSSIGRKESSASREDGGVQLGPVALFSTVLSAANIEEMRSLSSFDSWVINESMYTSSTDTTILFALDARNTHGDICYDTSPSQRHGKMLGDAEQKHVVHTSTFKESIWQLGGPLVVLPLLLSNRTVSPHQPFNEDTLPSTLSQNVGPKAIAATIALIAELIRNSSVNKFCFRKSHGLRMISLCLRLLPPTFLTLDLLTSLEKLTNAAIKDQYLSDDAYGYILFNMRIWGNANTAVQEVVFMKLHETITKLGYLSSVGCHITIISVLQWLPWIFYDKDNTNYKTISYLRSKIYKGSELKRIRQHVLRTLKLLISGNPKVPPPQSVVQEVIDYSLRTSKRPLDIEVEAVLHILLEQVLGPHGKNILTFIGLERWFPLCRRSSEQVRGLTLRLIRCIVTLRSGKEAQQLTSVQVMALLKEVAGCPCSLVVYNELVGILLGVGVKKMETTKSTSNMSFSTGIDNQTTLIPDGPLTTTRVKHTAFTLPLFFYAFDSDVLEVRIIALRHFTLLFGSDTASGAKNRLVLGSEVSEMNWIATVLSIASGHSPLTQHRFTDVRAPMPGLAEQSIPHLLNLFLNIDQSLEVRISAGYALGRDAKTVLDLLQNDVSSPYVADDLLERHQILKTHDDADSTLRLVLLQVAQRHLSSQQMNTFLLTTAIQCIGPIVALSIFDTNNEDNCHTAWSALCTPRALILVNALDVEQDDDSSDEESCSSFAPRSSNTTVFQLLLRVTNDIQSCAVQHQRSKRSLAYPGIAHCCSVVVTTILPSLVLTPILDQIVSNVMHLLGSFRKEFEPSLDASFTRKPYSGHSIRYPEYPGGIMRQNIQLELYLLHLYAAEISESRFSAELKSVQEMIMDMKLGQYVPSSEGTDFNVSQTSQLETNCALVRSSPGEETILTIWLIPQFEKLIDKTRHLRWTASTTLLAQMVGLLLTQPVRSIDELVNLCTCPIFVSNNSEIARKDSHFEQQLEIAHDQFVKSWKKRMNERINKGEDKKRHSDVPDIPQWMNTIRIRDEEDMSALRLLLVTLPNLSGVWCRTMATATLAASSTRGFWKIDGYTSSLKLRGRLVPDIDAVVPTVIQTSAKSWQKLDVTTRLAGSLQVRSHVSLERGSSLRSLYNANRDVDEVEEKSSAGDDSGEANSSPETSVRRRRFSLGKSSRSMSFRLKEGLPSLRSTDKSTALGSSTTLGSSSASTSPVSKVGSNERILLAHLVLPVGVVSGRLHLLQHAVEFHGTSFTPLSENSINQKESILRRRVWGIRIVSAIHRRRYLLQATALELFFINGTSCFLNFSTSSEVEHVHFYIAEKKPPCLMSSSSFIHNITPERWMKKQGWTTRWQRHEVSNFDYLMHLNSAAGRSYNDLAQYLIFPWILQDYTSDTLDLNDEAVFRDLSKPMGTLNTDRFATFKKSFETLQEKHKEVGSDALPPYHYDSMYSNISIVLQYLVRTPPFSAQAAALLGSDGIDTFTSLQKMYESCSASDQNDVRELIPEFFYFPEFLRNRSGLPLEDVTLPPWANGSPETFIRMHRMALESEYVSQHLHLWIDLIFGVHSRGKGALEKNNVFYYIAYDDQVEDIDTIADVAIRKEINEEIFHFGQVPAQLFHERHITRYSIEEALESKYPAAHEIASLSSKQQIRRQEVPTCHDMAIVAISFTRDLSLAYSVDENGHVSSHHYYSTTPDSKGFPFTITSESSKRTTPGNRNTSWHLPPGCTPSLATLYYEMLISCGHWDGSWRITWGSDGEPVQRIPFHKKPIVTMATSKDVATGDLALAFGSEDGTISVWALSKYSASRKNRRFVGKNAPLPVGTLPWSLLTGHTSAVTCVALNVDLDVVVSGSSSSSSSSINSSNSLVLIHALRSGIQLHAFYLSPLPNIDPGYVSNVVYMAISTFGDIVVHRNTTQVGSDLSLLSMNGTLQAVHSVAGEVKDAVHLLPPIVFSNCGMFIVTASIGRQGRHGGIDVRVASSLQVLRRIEGNPTCHLTAFAVSEDERCVLAGHEDGSITAYALHFGLAVHENNIKKKKELTKAVQAASLNEICSVRLHVPSDKRLSSYESAPFDVMSVLFKDLRTPCVAGQPVFEGLLIDFWKAIHKVPLAFERSGQAWTSMGFQRPDPTTDFRAGGLLSLRCLIHFAQHSQSELIDMVEYQVPGSRENTYPVGPAAINITCRLCGMLWDSVGKLNLCQRKTWQLLKSPESFYELFGEAFRIFDFHWTEMEAEYSVFSKVMQATEDEIQRLLKHDNVMDIDKLKKLSAHRRRKYMDENQIKQVVVSSTPSAFQERSNASSDLVDISINGNVGRENAEMSLERLTTCDNDTVDDLLDFSFPVTPSDPSNTPSFDPFA